MQLPERNAVSSPSIVGQIRIGRDIHGRDEREARLPAQEGRGIPHARAAAGAAAMFGRARPAPPPWLCSAGLCGAGSAPPLMSARGGPATCASRPPHGRTDAAPAARHRHGRTERPAAEGGKRPLQLTAEPAPPGAGSRPRRQNGGREAIAQVNPKLPPRQQVNGGPGLEKQANLPRQSCP